VLTKSVVGIQLARIGKPVRLEARKEAKTLTKRPPAEGSTMDSFSALLVKIEEICRHLFNSQELMAVLGRADVTLAAFLVINLVIFVETGLFVGFFLPGDSLLVTAGLVCFHSGWSLPVLLLTVCLAAIIGDSVGYSIGATTGPRIFTREKSFFFARGHLLRAKAFYERHGGKTIVLARFMPIIRTFAPVVAGAAGMDYRRFLFFNIFGGIGWVSSMVLTGYYLTNVLDPMLKPIFGDQFRVQDHIEKVVLVVVFLSISPGLYAWLRSRVGKSRTPPPETPATVLAAPAVSSGIQS
jgi:membrane-associated protein